MDYSQSAMDFPDGHFMGRNDVFRVSLAVNLFNPRMEDQWLEREAAQKRKKILSCRRKTVVPLYSPTFFHVLR